MVAIRELDKMAHDLLVLLLSVCKNENKNVKTSSDSDIWANGDVSTILSN